MLIEFRVGNFLSFNQIVSLNMTASPDSYLEETSVFTDSKYRLLKSAVIYGANAGGKSNLLKAVAFMRRFVFESSKESQATEDIEIENFRLSTESEDQPSFFEIIFICDQKKYRYGFEADTRHIRSEWLFLYRAGRRQSFLREMRQVFGQAVILRKAEDWKAGQGPMRFFFPWSRSLTEKWQTTS